MPAEGKANALAQEVRLKARAELLWIASGCNAVELTYKEFIATHVHEGMVKYMSTHAKRLRCIQKTIDDGYDAHVSFFCPL